MIDTVVLAIPYSYVVPLDEDYRGTSGWHLQSGSNATYKKYVLNPSKLDLESGDYYPRLTRYARARKGNKVSWETIVNIEFSVPKLLYKNNIDELTDANFKEIVNLLQTQLEQMGVGIEKEYLEHASVTTVHFSKNMLLKNGYSSQYVISELGKINLNKCFDLARARYLNDGQSLCAHTRTHEIVMYDKIADLARGKKRSIDREQTPHQLGLFQPLTKRPEPVEVLRIEIRLCQRQKINTLFKKLGFQQNPTFKDVFDSKKSQKVLMYYWDTMIDGNMSLLFAHSLTSKNLLRQILLSDKKLKPKQAIYLTGLVSLLQDGNGARELRTILSKYSNDRTWYRLISDAKKTSLGLSKLKPREWYEQVHNGLRDYKPVHTADLQCKEL